MPTVKDKTTGDVISRQPYTAIGTQRAEQIAETDPNWDINYAPGGKEDAMERTESYQLGGLIPGAKGFGQRPINPILGGNQPISPIMKKGGKVKKYKK